MLPPKHKRPALLIAVGSLSISVALLVSCSRIDRSSATSAVPQKKAASSEEVAALDRALTDAATEALGDYEGAVLVMDPRTGRLRAVVNPRLAFEQAFPPGSTIKSFTTLTAMRAGLIDRETRMLCPGRFTGDGFEIVCSHPKSKAPFNFAQVLAYSCNYSFATLSGRLSFDAFRSTLAGAGFGTKTGVNAAESAGILRDTDWKVRNLLGEGENVLVTPIQLLTAYCALMNGGHLFRPQLADGEKYAAEERTNLHIESPQRKTLIEGMRGAVVYGTAEKAKLDALPAFIFGKTGTSTSSNGFRRQGWFVSFAANATAPDEVTPESLELAVLVFLKRSHGSDAAVVSHRVFEEYLKRKGAESTGRAEEYEAAERDFVLANNGQQQTMLRVKILSQNRVVKIPLETYVLGVLSLEAGAEDQLEALKAQAIVSRTYAIKNRGRHANEGFDLCSNTHCQQYAETGAPASAKIQRAVTATSGEILREANGLPADAYFHAACGGHTANFESLWGTAGPSYLRGVRDEYCVTMPHHDWTDEISAARLGRALAGDPLTDAGRTLRDVIVTKQDATGRAEIVTIEGERRRQVRGWAFKLIVGRSLGWNVLKSSRFRVSRRGSMFVFRGSGFGHGLGLCQNGAHVMARRGARCEQILNKYFPGAGVSGSNTRAAMQKKDAPSDVGATYYAKVGFRADPSPPLPFSRSPFQSLTSEHFRVSYPAQVPRAEIESAIRNLEAARLDMLARAGSALVPSKQLEVIFHNTTQDFMAATGQPWWVAGATRGHRIELQPSGVLRRRRILSSTLRHEYAHAVIELSGESGTPRWLAEGLAISFAGEGPLLLRYKSPARLPLEELERRLARPGSLSGMRSLYASAYYEVRELIRKEGEPSVWRRVSNRAVLRTSITRSAQVAYRF